MSTSNSNLSSSKTTVSISALPCRSTRSHARLQLKANLSTIQKGNSSISEYFCKIKEIADALASVHEPLSDLDLVSATLRGLGDDWIDIYAAIRHRSTVPTISELHALLLQRISRCWENENEAKMLRIQFVKPEIISWAPRIIVLHDFLSSEECDHLIAIARPRLHPTKVQDAETGKVIKSDNRTCFGKFLSKQESKNPIVQAIEKRISVFSQVPVENGEVIQVLRYEKNQFFRLHHDYFSDTSNLKQGGQRIATMLMYLSDNVEGGETYFPMAGTGKCSCAGKMKKGLSVKSIKGDAVLFWSMGLDGKEDPRSIHAGCEVLSGEKWTATKWMRQNKHN
ncbi:prolyl 4-hydroxylase 1-like [Papaver somniferum]|uniref:prolyl 4-hydroxylase 1-like n=1 Tax=Papaver somniferum TaxID=3469 RepID=UPI000E6FC559|nr:prolyl 4-hydroxylase 1-like [Papaver somniferum]